CLPWQISQPLYLKPPNKLQCSARLPQGDTLRVPHGRRCRWIHANPHTSRVGALHAKVPSWPRTSSTPKNPPSKLNPVPNSAHAPPNASAPKTKPPAPSTASAKTPSPSPLTPLKP